MSHDDYEYPEEAFHAGTWEPVPARRNVRRLRLVGGIVVAAMLLIGGGAAWLGLVMNNRLAAPLGAVVDAPRNAAAVQLVTGNCVAQLPADGNVTTVRVVPCDHEHAAQVYSQYAFEQDAVWPGQADAHARVAGACQLTVALEDAGVGVVTWAPSPSSWQRGDRTGLCLAVLPAPSTDSLFDPGTLTS
ncbi:MAG: hypothetical protein GX593_14970 [Actinomycetales bacterium]|nr:hypothetical protein [Actinomycetales bacterium]